MRILSFILTITVCQALNAQTPNPYLNLKYDKVVFYDFQIMYEPSLVVIDSTGRFVPAIVKQVELDSPTIKKLNKELGSKKSYAEGTASCFNPHCGFVYYLHNKPVAQITICVECNRLYSTIEIPAQLQGAHEYEGNVYYMSDGLSKSFRKYINGLLKQYEFSHQIKEGSIFDY